MILRTTAPSRLMLTLITLLALGLTDARAQPNACGSDIRRIEVNQTTLHYFECGNGEPLIFVHGATGDLHSFRDQVQTFATRFRVIAYSRRFSPPNAPPRETDLNPMSNHVADLRALITQLKATPAHLVGSSYGAYVAVALAVDHPELVRSLVLGEPPIRPLLPPKSVGDGSQPSQVQTEFIDLTDELVEKYADLRALLRTEPAAAFPPLDCGNLGKLTRPTHLLTGERSPEYYHLITAELERCLEGESQVMVPEAGHTMHRESTAFYNQAVLAFLQRASSGTGSPHSRVPVERCASAPKPIEHRRPGESSMHISETEVAFTVHMPGDPVPATVRGTVFYTEKFDPNQHRAVLLLHGGTLDRRFWDGFKIPGALRFAAELACQSDTAVFTVDRLGYGESPYDRGPGSGFKLTPDTNVENTHEVIAQIRKGSYEVLDGPAPPRGAAGVVLGGQSYGAALSELYATRHQDIDGLMPFGWSSQGSTLPDAKNSMFVKINEVVTPQLDAGADYIYFFPPEENGRSRYCEQAVYHAPGMDPDILTQACANGLHNRVPAGELAGAQAMTKEITANISKVGPIPVLFMFGRQDNMVPGPEWGGLEGNDVDIMTPEIAHWKANCKCRFSVYVIEDTSHDFPLHKSAESTVKEMSKWLRSF